MMRSRSWSGFECTGTAYNTSSQSFSVTHQVGRSIYRYHHRFLYVKRQPPRLATGLELPQPLDFVSFAPNLIFQVEWPVGASTTSEVASASLVVYQAILASTVFNLTTSLRVRGASSAGPGDFDVLSEINHVWIGRQGALKPSTPAYDGPHPTTSSLSVHVECQSTSAAVLDSVSEVLRLVQECNAPTSGRGGARYKSRAPISIRFEDINVHQLSTFIEKVGHSTASAVGTPVSRLSFFKKAHLATMAKKAQNISTHVKIRTQKFGWAKDDLAKVVAETTKLYQAHWARLSRNRQEAFKMSHRKNGLSLMVITTTLADGAHWKARIYPKWIAGANDAEIVSKVC